MIQFTRVILFEKKNGDENSFLHRRFCYHSKWRWAIHTQKNVNMKCGKKEIVRRISKKRKQTKIKNSRDYDFSVWVQCLVFSKWNESSSHLIAGKLRQLFNILFAVTQLERIVVVQTLKIIYGFANCPNCLSIYARIGINQTIYFKRPNSCQHTVS